MLSRNLSIEDKIMRSFTRAQWPLRYKGMSVGLFGFPTFSSYKKQSVANALQRLKKSEYISYGDGLIKILPKGRKYVESKKAKLEIFDSPFAKGSPKNLLVMFDIPEGQKAEREWFRFHLRKFGYGMIQRSVWVGPSPLPKDFNDYVKNIKLEKCIKTFKLAKPYTQN